MDAVGRGLKRVALHGGQACECGLPFAARDFERGDAIGLDVVELARIPQHRGVAFGAHLVQDARCGGFNRLVLRSVERQQFGQGCVKRRIACIQAVQDSLHLNPPFS